jgi:hypothetical protein
VVDVERQFRLRQPLPENNNFLRLAAVSDPANFAGGSGAGTVPNSRDADYDRSILPELAHMSDSYLTQHSLDKLQKYVNLLKKQSEDKVEKNLESQMAQKLKNAIKKPVSIAGQDNRYDKLHRKSLGWRPENYGVQIRMRLSLNSICLFWAYQDVFLQKLGNSFMHQDLE